MYQDRFDDAEWTYACRFSAGGDSDADYAQHLQTMKEVAGRAEAAKKRRPCHRGSRGARTAFVTLSTSAKADALGSQMRIADRGVSSA